MSSQHPIQATQNWIHHFVLAHNLCPFAHTPVRENRVRYACFDGESINDALGAFIDELLLLEQSQDIQTSFFILRQCASSFLTLLDFAESADVLIESAGLNGIYQTASFHPEYYFENSDISDPANATNRSPYPMLHIIRAADVYHARQTHPDVESIPIRNINHLRQLAKDDSQTDYP